MHLRKHSAKVYYLCDFCGMGFKYSASFKSHKAVHTNDRPFECDICKIKFKYTRSLKRHKETHVTAKKQQSCNACGKNLSRLDALRKHMKKCKKMQHQVEKGSADNESHDENSQMNEDNDCHVCIMANLMTFSYLKIILLI